MANKLELTWVGKEERIEVEPRILIEVPDKSFSESADDLLTAATFDNMLIHGDNLLALKALESKFAGQVKCIYIDPPYNTGNAFEHYDDNLEHSIWLNLMRPRLEILHNLLSEDGTIWIQIDDEEQAYLKVLCDEVLGRANFVQMISVKRASPAGFKVINPGPLTVTDYILLYAKDKQKMQYFPQRIPVTYDDNYDLLIENPQQPPAEWTFKKLVDILYEKFGFKDWKDAKKAWGSNWKDVRNGLLGDIALEYAESVVSVRDPHKPSDMLKQKLAESKETPWKVIVIERENYNPIYVLNGGSLSFYKEKLRNIDGTLVPTELLTDFWADINFAGIAKEGGVKFKNSKKPEMLVRRVLDLATNPGDLVLDSFLGSGTTAAVAHKMGRRWIGIEMGDHAYTHCKVRMDKVIKGEDSGGITKAVKWTKGGGYKFYELAPTLIKLDAFGEPVINKEYDADRLAAAVALHEGFNYQPDAECFWKQSVGNEQSYLFVTTTHISAQHLDAIKNTMQDGEFLIIACKSFDQGIEKAYKEISIKKIPQMLLDRCKFGVADYNLNIVNPPVYEDEEECND